VDLYVLDEGDGAVGTVCIYETTSQEAIRTHASRAGLPVDEIIPILETAVIRPDPGPGGLRMRSGRRDCGVERKFGACGGPGV
jgi:hypothetical protein